MARTKVHQTEHTHFIDMSEVMIEDMWRDVQDATIECAEDFEQIMKERVSRKVGVPSHPGEPPAMQTGYYRKNIKSDWNIPERGLIRAYVGFQLPGSKQLAIYFEEGTQKMAKRPHWGVALAENIHRYQEIMARPFRRYQKDVE